MATKLIDKYLNKFITDEEYVAIEPQINVAHDILH